MRQIRTINKLLIGLIVVLTFFFLVGITYSYFLADIINPETATTLTGESGMLDIEYDGGSAITATGFAPSITPFATKTFTLKANSNIEGSILGYKIILVVDENTFSENALSYTLSSTNTDENGEIVPAINANQVLNTSNIELGTGHFTGVATNAYHTYELKLFFLDTDEDQTEDMEQSIKVHIKVENYIDPCTINNCLNNHIISLAENSTETGVYNENGYRYEGLDPNNYVSFNNETWRIIGVFDDETHGITGKNLVKIIREDSIDALAWDEYNENNWNSSSLKAYLNGDYYASINQASKSLIENVIWKLGGIASMSTAGAVYTAERDTTVYSGHPTSWIGNIGLMYPSDYGYAVLEATCTRDTTLMYYFEDGCFNQNWLYSGSYEWTLTHYPLGANNVFHTSYEGFLIDNNAQNDSNVRPTLYLKSSTTIIDGDGSFENPYELCE